LRDAEAALLKEISGDQRRVGTLPGVNAPFARGSQLPGLHAEARGGAGDCDLDEASARFKAKSFDKGTSWLGPR
jgi:hypothetical protein